MLFSIRYIGVVKIAHEKSFKKEKRLLRIIFFDVCFVKTADIQKNSDIVAYIDASVDL